MFSIKSTSGVLIVLFGTLLAADSIFAETYFKKPYLEFSVGGTALNAQSASGALTTIQPGQANIYSNLIGRMEQENTFGPVLNLAAGAAITDIVRAALSVSYFQEDQVVRSMATEPGDASSGHNSTTSYLNAQTWLFMANLYADFGSYLSLVPPHVKPYVGAGIGLANNRLGNQFTFVDGNGVRGVARPNSRNDFAYRLMAGINFNISRRCLFQVQYAFVYAGRYVSGTTGYAPGVTFRAIPYKFPIYANQFSLGLQYFLA